MAKITVLFGNDPQGEYTLEHAEHTVGRARDCHIVVDNLGVSRHHCSICQDGDGWKIVDKGSNNGTFLNGSQVQDQRLNHDDRIVLGKYSLVFDAHGYAASSEGGAGGAGQAGGMGAEMTMFVDPEAIKQIQAKMKGGSAPSSSADKGSGSGKGSGSRKGTSSGKGSGSRKGTRTNTSADTSMDLFVLSVMQGGREAKITLTSKDIAIGKGSDADLPVKGFLVKPIQAKVMKSDKGWRVTSFGGFRGVKVNGNKIQDRLLKNGDRINIAGTTITFKKA